MDMVSPRLEADGCAEAEIELKLTTSPDNLTQLLKLIPKKDGVDADSKVTKRLVSTYFDTQDRRLRRKGLTLRVRDKAGTKEQTVKSEGTTLSGVFSRQEWTTPVKGKDPDLSRFKSKDLHGQMGLILPQELTPLFKTDVKRTTFIVDHSIAPGESAKIELAVDRGRIVSGKKKLEIAEVELELVSGTTTALIDFARVIADTVPTVLSLSSKVERGFRLCDNAFPRARTSYKQSLPKTGSTEECMVLIFRSALAHLLENRSAAVNGTDIEGVHQVRVANRRIKSALSVFNKVLACEKTSTLRANSDWLLDTLGLARDLDVFLDETLAAVIADRPNDPDLIALVKAATKARVGAYRRVKTALSSKRYTKAVLTLAAWVEQRHWRLTSDVSKLEEPVQVSAGKRLSHHRKKVLKLGQEFETLSPEARHNVRLALKKMRYAAEFFSSLYPTNKTRPYIATLKSLQNDLGAANDVSVAENLCQTLTASAKPGSRNAIALQKGSGKVIGWHTRAADEAERNIVSHWTAFAKAHPFWSAD